MRIAIIGSRTFDNAALLKETLAKVKTPVTCIVSGGAEGADTLGKHYAWDNGLDYEEYLPAWKQPWWSPSYCTRTAAAIRNSQIMEAAEGVIAFWNGDEKSGTAQAIRIAKSLGKPVHIVKF